ncbi:hypothetical protein AAMO2058_001207100 [Amorphochlora amoebiformis]
MALTSPSYVERSKVRNLAPKLALLTLFAASILGLAYSVNHGNGYVAMATSRTAGIRGLWTRNPGPQRHGTERGPLVSTKGVRGKIALPKVMLGSIFSRPQASVDIQENNINNIQKWIRNQNAVEVPDCLTSLRERNKGRRICIIVNPTSGARKGLDILNSKVLPILNEGGIFKIKTLITTSRYSVPKQVQEMDLDSVDDLLVIGGDGTLSGVFIGLGEHTHKDAMSFPVGLIPCGSHNHMFKVMSGFKNVHSKITEKHLISSLLRLVEGKTERLPIPLVQSSGDKHKPFMCGLSFALLAAAFNTSEGLRWTGLRKARYYAAILWQIMKMKQYRYKVRYLPHTSREEPPKSLPTDFSSEWKTEEGPYQWFGFSPLSFGVDRENAINSKWGYMMIIEKAKSPLAIIRTILRPKLSDWETQENARLERVKAFAIEPIGETQKDWNMDGEKMKDFKQLYVHFADTEPNQATFVG